MLTAELDCMNLAEPAAVDDFFCRRDVAVVAEIQHEPDCQFLFRGERTDFRKFLRRGAERLIRDDMLSRFEPGNRAAAADTEVISDCQNIEIGVCKQIGKTGVRDIDSPVFLCFSRSLRVFFARRDDFALRTSLRRL